LIYSSKEILKQMTYVTSNDKPEIEAEEVYDVIPITVQKKRREKEPYNPVNVNKELYNPATLRHQLNTFGIHLFDCSYSIIPNLPHDIRQQGPLR
jgi:hypothetical protein